MAESKAKVTAIVLAAGAGKRMQSDVKKQYILIRQKPVIYYTLLAFEKSSVDEVILVTSQSEIDYCRNEIVADGGFSKVTHIVAGGRERFHSVYEGLKAAKGADYVLIHDGARPLITPELIDRNIECVIKDKACITAVPSKDTVKIADAEGFVSQTPERAYVWNIQTPQSFAYDLVMGAYQKLIDSGDEAVTDDAMVVERYTEHRVRLLMGDYQNIKITTPEDLDIAERFLKG